MSNIRRKQTIKEWETETGIKVKEATGFKGSKSKIKTNKYTKEGFRKGVERSYITIKCEKGIEFMRGESESNTYWKSYIKFNSERRAKRKWQENTI